MSSDDTHSPIGTAVTVCECWPRDGLQGWPAVVPANTKIDVIRRVIAAGIAEVDLTSFVPARTSPQFADAAEVLGAFDGERPADGFRVLAVNLRSFDGIAAAQDATGAITTVGFPISASEAHNLANLHREHADHKRQLTAMIERCRQLGLAPLLCVATAFGCPLTGVVPARTVLDLASWAHDLGVRRIMLGDTTGEADPVQAYELFAALRHELPGVEPIAHFHDTRGAGLANTWAALWAGVRHVDASLGGTGGEPSVVEQNHRGATGNVATEDLVAMLDRAGVRTGIDLDGLLDAGAKVEAALGRELFSQVQRAGVASPREKS
jgi:hydroxymethylglutaryl-CoA lyase